MAEVVSLAQARTAKSLNVEQAWTAYVAAKTKADETLKIEDGIAAAKMFRLFLEQFVRI